MDIERTLKLLNIDNEEIKVFVYGTLMKGNSNYQDFLSEAKFIGEVIAEGFALYDLGNYPGIIPSEIDKVKGQLYTIDNNTLIKLDELEEEGSLYLRKLINVVKDNNEVKRVYTYVYNHDVSRKIKVNYEDQPWGQGKEINMFGTQVMDLIFYMKDLVLRNYSIVYRI